MKFLLLVIITTWSFGGMMGVNSRQIVSSPQEAAIMVWQNQQNRVSIEPDRYEYKLYEIDLERGTVKTIEIPVLKFYPEENNNG